MNKISPTRLLDWIIAGGCSLAIHVGVLVVLFWTSSSSNATPAAPLDTNAPLADLSASPAADPAAGASAGTAAEPVAEPAPEPAARPARSSRPASRSSRSASTVSLADAVETSFAETGKPVATSSRHGTAAKPAKPAVASDTRTVNYTVKRGDNFTRLARECGCTNAELAALNGKKEKDFATLQPGQVIKLKVKE